MKMPGFSSLLSDFLLEFYEEIWETDLSPFPVSVKNIKQFVYYGEVTLNENKQDKFDFWKYWDVYIYCCH